MTHEVPPPADVGADQQKLPPKDWACLTCGHAHYFEADDGGFDGGDNIPWGRCKTCGCKAPNYRELAAPAGVVDPPRQELEKVIARFRQAQAHYATGCGQSHADWARGVRDVLDALDAITSSAAKPQRPTTTTDTPD